MIIFNIVVWSIVSAVWAWLAWWKVCCRHYVHCEVVGTVKHPVELAAQFIRRGDFVLANDVLRDEYGVELGHPAQIGYCSFDPEDAIGGALERTARVLAALRTRRMTPSSPLLVRRKLSASLKKLPCRMSTATRTL